MVEREAFTLAQVERPCRNCGAHGVRQFCPTCGQETADRIPTIREWLREVRDEYWMLDGKVTRSVASLVARPGLLTSEWIAGRRQQYIRPFRLFVVVLPVMLIGTGFDRVAQWSLVPASVVTLTAASYFTGMSARVRASLVPHLVLALHSHSLLLVLLPVAVGVLEVSELLGVAMGWAVFSLFLLALMTYVAGAYRRWLDMSWRRAILRSLVVLLLYGLTLSALSAAAMAIGALALEPDLRATPL